jgi:cobalt-zinc-cadmium efflux system membrane fusion protein
MTTYKFISIAIISFSLVFLSCNGGKKTAETIEAEEVLPEDIVELRADQIELADIELGKIELRALNNTLKANGNVIVTPQSFATVCAPMGGFVKSASLMPGNSVGKGQTLATIENPEFVDLQQNYLETKNRFEYAEAEYKRHTELFKNDVYSEKNLQQVTTEFKTLKTQLKALEQKLSMIGINPSKLNDENISSLVALVSPISGSVKTVNANIGKYVSANDVLFEIVNSDNLFLEITLFEKDANKVSKDQRIRFYINNETEQHEAVITQTGKTVDADKTYKVYASVIGKCENVLPGMYVNTIIETSGNTVASLPSEAVVSFDDHDYIFIHEKEKEEDGKPFTEYRMIEVTKGVTDSGFTEIILPEGFNITTAKVVVKGAYNLLSAKKNAGEMAC